MPQVRLCLPGTGGPSTCGSRPNGRRLSSTTARGSKGLWWTVVGATFLVRDRVCGTEEGPGGRGEGRGSGTRVVLPPSSLFRLEVKDPTEDRPRLGVTPSPEPQRSGTRVGSGRGRKTPGTPSYRSRPTGTPTSRPDEEDLESQNVDTTSLKSDSGYPGPSRLV